MAAIITTQMMGEAREGVAGAWVRHDMSLAPWYVFFFLFFFILYLLNIYLHFELLWWWQMATTGHHQQQQLQGLKMWWLVCFFFLLMLIVTILLLTFPHSFSSYALCMLLPHAYYFLFTLLFPSTDFLFFHVQPYCLCIASCTVRLLMHSSAQSVY